MSTIEPKLGRRPKARPRDVIFGCIEERLSMVGGILERASGYDELQLHVSRLRELIDELRRATNGKEAE